MKKFTYIFIIILVFLAACDNTTKSSELLVERGKALLEGGYPQDALTLYQKALIKNPNYEDAYLQSAILYDEYLDDQTNAIIAYEKFLSISDNSAMRKRVQTWILELKKGKKEFLNQNQNINDTDSILQAELAQKGDQFGILREQLVERYEAKLEKVNQQNHEVNEKVIDLKIENNILRSDLSKKEILKFVDTISSNDTLIANLEAKLEEQTQENKTTIKSLKFLQNMVNELQNKNESRSEKLIPVSTILESNTILTAELEILTLKLKSLEAQKADLSQQLLSNSDLTQTSETYSSANFETLIFATNKVLKLEQKNSFLEQAKENLINELFKQQKLTAFKNNQLEDLNKKVKKYQKLLLNYKLVKNQLEEEKSSNDNWKQILYDRTVSLKKLKKQYNNLYQRHQIELNKNKEINEKISSIQTDLSSFNLANKPSNKTKVSEPHRTRTRTYTVKRGDSLANLAKRVYGDSKKWTVIFQANRDILDKPNQLRVGQILKVP